MSTEAVAADQIRAFVERIERMEEEKASITEDIKEIYAEAKGNGFDTKVLRAVVRIRKQDRAERLEFEALLDLYLEALGMGLGATEDEQDKAEAAARRSIVGQVMDGIEGALDVGKAVEAAAASPKMRRATRDFVKSMEKMGGDVTLSSGGRSVTIRGKGKPKSDPVGFDLGEGV